LNYTRIDVRSHKYLDIISQLIIFVNTFFQKNIFFLNLYSVYHTFTKMLYNVGIQQPKGETF